MKKTGTSLKPGKDSKKRITSPSVFHLKHPVNTTTDEERNVVTIEMEKSRPKTVEAAKPKKTLNQYMQAIKKSKD